MGFVWPRPLVPQYQYRQSQRISQGLPLKPNRLPIDKDYLSAYCELLWNLDSATIEDYCEARAMYTTGIRYNTLWADQALRASEKLEQVHSHICILNSALQYTPVYANCLTAVYELIYSPVVEGWPAWEKCTEDIDARSIEMYPEEYSSIIQTIERHGVEITNCRSIMNRQTLCANTAAKNYVSYSSLYSEVVNSSKALAPVRRPLQEYLRVKIHCAFDAGFLSVREFHALGQRLTGSGVGTMHLD